MTLFLTVSHNENIKLEGENEKLKKEKNEKELKEKLFPKTGEVKLLTHSGEETLIKTDEFKEYKKYHDDITLFENKIKDYEDKIRGYIDQSIEYEEKISKLEKDYDDTLEQLNNLKDAYKKAVERGAQTDEEIKELEIELEEKKNEVNTKQTNILIQMETLKELEIKRQLSEDKIIVLEEKIKESEKKHNEQIKKYEYEDRVRYLESLSHVELKEIASDFNIPLTRKQKYKNSGDKTTPVSKAHLISEIKLKDPKLDIIYSKHINKKEERKEENENKKNKQTEDEPDASTSQQAEGIGGTDGLWTDEIDKIMHKYRDKGFKGTYSIDELNKIPINGKEKIISFIMNTRPSYEKTSGHWVSVYITPENLEYIDSFADEPSDEFLKNIKPLIDKFSPNRLLQFKVNRIKKQRNNSNNCGYFAIKSIVDRYGGKNFKDITEFNKLENSIEGEKEIKAFKKKLKPFEYI